MLDTKTAWRPLPGSQTLALSCPAHIIVYSGTRGPGKGLPLDEPIYTPNGVRQIGDLRVGDEVSCPDGLTTRVIGVFPQGVRPVYELEFYDGSIARCDDQHIWSLNLGGYNRTPAGVYKNYTMPEVLRLFKQGSYRLNIPTLNEIDLGVEGYLPIDPYTLGLFLGDGSSSQRGAYCTVDDELAQHVVNNGFREVAKDTRNDVRYFSCNRDFTEAYYELGLKEVRSQTKFVPEVYLHASVESRLALLQGLMDTDGAIDKNGYVTFCSTSKKLARDVQYLARSLGARATLTSRIPKIGTVEFSEAFQIYIQTGNKFAPFRLKRKLNLIRPYMQKHLTNKIVRITELAPAETVCIKIEDPDGLFITRDFVVTHNTDSQLIRFRRNVGQGYGRHWRGIIFDREYKNLDDLVSKSMRWFPEISEPGAGPKDKPRFLSSKSDYRWVWPTGEELLFRAVKRDTDYWGYHGQEFPFIGWNELTKFPTDTLFDAMMSCNRSSFRPEDFPQYRYDENGSITEEYFLPEIPLEVFATCNPHGSGHNWVKKRFVNPAPMGQIVKRVVNVFNPKTQQREDVIKTQVHLFGSYKENIYLSPEYIAELESITDQNKRKAWLQGDWDIVAGGMFDGHWDSVHHILKPFKIPHSWKIDRSFDWGSSKPFSVGWWAESDGSDVQMPDGTWRSTVKGDTFRIAEWYGWSGKANQGLHMLAVKIAAGIVEREIAMGLYGRVKPGPADNSIWDTENGNSIAVDMLKPVTIKGSTYSGVQWIRSDKSAGSRKAGWEKIRKYLQDGLPQYVLDINGKKIRVPRERPGLFVFNTCVMFIDLFPILPRSEEDPDDVDTDSEDHIGDETRYEILSKALQASSGTTKGT